MQTSINYISQTSQPTLAVAFLIWPLTSVGLGLVFNGAFLAFSSAFLAPRGTFFLGTPLAPFLANSPANKRRWPSLTAEMSNRSSSLLRFFLLLGVWVELRLEGLLGVRLLVSAGETARDEERTGVDERDERSLDTLCRGCLGTVNSKFESRLRRVGPDTDNRRDGGVVDTDVIFSFPAILQQNLGN